ncbi:septum formation protein Maf [Klebsiella aerogenes]|nr:septum formation protein Maf [Klebsiella aerogenes]VTO14138.1 septum formation protein Maf [Klebsiella variicola]
MTTLYLASGSPRRQELLTQLGLTFERLVPGIEEQRQPQESAEHYVVRLAREKAQAGVAMASRDLPVLGRIRLSFLTAKCWRNRATLNTLQQCCVCFPAKRIRS